MGEEGSAEEVVAAPRVITLPPELQDTGRSDALAGMENGAEILLPRAKGERALRPLDGGSPLPRPADGRDHSSALPLDIEEGRDVGRAPSRRGDLQAGLGAHPLIEGHPVVDEAGGTIEAMDDHIASQGRVE